ncbi:MAG: HPr family phosphocarrier protein [Sphingomonadales bacterium]
MQEQTAKTEQIVNKRGLHARASAKFVDVAEKFQSKISVEKEGTKVSGKSIMGLLLLAAANGESVTIEATGRDAEEAVLVLAHLVKSGFYETD